MPKAFPEESVTDEIIRMINTKEVKVHVKQKKIPEDNNRKLYYLMWGNCTDNMKSKIKFSTKYQNMNDDKNGINLINDPEQVTLKYEDQHYPHE